MLINPKSESSLTMISGINPLAIYGNPCTVNVHRHPSFPKKSLAKRDAALYNLLVERSYTLAERGNAFSSDQVHCVLGFFYVKTLLMSLHQNVVETVYAT